jgi:hypothetical protein
VNEALPPPLPLTIVSAKYGPASAPDKLELVEADFRTKDVTGVVRAQLADKPWELNFKADNAREFSGGRGPEGMRCEKEGSVGRIRGGIVGEAWRVAQPAGV